MISVFSDKEFLNWFPENKFLFSATIRKRLEWMYIDNAEKMTAAYCTVLAYKIRDQYVGFLRYNAGSARGPACINLDYIGVESSCQKEGIGLELSSHAIDEGKARGCIEVYTQASDAALPLIQKLQHKYPEIEFRVIETGYHGD